MQVVIKTTDHELIRDLKAQNIDGLSISQRFMDSVPTEVVNCITHVLTFGSGVSAQILASWLYDKTKAKRNEKTVINGNQINADTINITVINQILLGEQHCNHDSDKPSS